MRLLDLARAALYFLLSRGAPQDDHAANVDKILFNKPIPV
jgi:hypothetical protein